MLFLSEINCVRNQSKIDYEFEEFLNRYSISPEKLQLLSENETEWNEVCGKLPRCHPLQSNEYHLHETASFRNQGVCSSTGL